MALEKHQIDQKRYNEWYSDAWENLDKWEFRTFKPKPEDIIADKVEEQSISDLDIKPQSALDFQKTAPGGTQIAPFSGFVQGRCDDETNSMYTSAK